ncbi:glucoamylase family protein [Adhaeribacter radiodurans]|uniref:Beta-glucosidase n=1 Tax=Adhaeribacter radiodurans TaxID=2745197 RepID=A0A7L7LA59_9BACT|nr:glucoamylase family protein [Adhaeribacter radiodurans]QMU29721.1 beta-glucosidase [Adhaeribacter radiodurans]
MTYSRQPYLYLLFIITLISCKAKEEENVTPPVITPEIAPVTPDKEILDEVQQATLQYFWEYAHPVSAMARERTGSGDLVTSGGTGFGISALVVGVNRGWINRAEAVDRLTKMCEFLKNADRFHGAWSHWLDGNTGKAIAFSPNDNGGDLVETSFLINGLLTARTYFTGADAKETELRNKITQLWETVEWDWYASRGDNQLYWHWSPDYNWEMNMAIRGWNECLITYILALSSPTHAMSPAVYQNTFQASGFVNGQPLEGYLLPIGPSYGGPLFFAHYSFLGLDPRQMQDQYTFYWEQNVKHTLINRAYCLFAAPKNYGYHAGLWGLTASDDPDGYKAHQPMDDNGTVSPTAAISSMPYTPYYSMQVLRHLYTTLNKQLYGSYGFYDAYNKSRGWVAKDYLAIDQGPIVVMIENYRSGLLWSLFHQIPEVQNGLTKANIKQPNPETGFYLAIPEIRSGLYDLLKHPDQNKYPIDVSIKDAGGFTLTLEKENGSVTENIWQEEQKAPGLYPITFGENVPAGKYTLRLSSLAGENKLVVYLH